MPCRTTWEKHGILWEFHGDVTGREVDHVNDRFVKDIRRHDVSYQLIDARGVTSTDWTARDAHLIAAKDFGANLKIKGLKLAFVASDPGFLALVDEYVKQSEDMQSSWEFRLFDTIEEAREWVEPRAANSAGSAS